MSRFNAAATAKMGLVRALATNILFSLRRAVSHAPVIVVRVVSLPLDLSLACVFVSG